MSAEMVDPAPLLDALDQLERTLVTSDREVPLADLRDLRAEIETLR